MNFINSKKIETLLILKDFIIIFYFYNYQFIKVFNNISNQIVIYCLISFWILIKYILGQYEKKNIFNTKELIISFSCNISIFLLSNIIYFLINLITEGLNLDSQELIFFFNTSIKITFLSFTFDTFIYFIFNKKLKVKRSWLVISSKETFLDLVKLSSKIKCDLKPTYIENIYSDLEENHYKGIIIDNSYFQNQEIVEIISSIKSKGLVIINPMNWCDKYLHKCPSTTISQPEILSIQSTSNKNLIQFRIKRFNDVFISSILLLVLSPIFFIIIIILFLFEGKPIFYSQTRTGLNNKIILISKFRTMIINAEIDGPQWSGKNDTRITKLGKILRKYRLDELPQLISVIKGEMSLIGPRPERPEIEKLLKEKIPHYNLRNLVKPGISGWAQVNYHYGANLDDSINKLSYDIYYVKNFSLALDLIILFKTLKIIFQAKGSQPKT